MSCCLHTLILGVYHSPKSLRKMLVLSFDYIILLLCIWTSHLMTYPIFSEVLRDFILHVFSPVVGVQTLNFSFNFSFHSFFEYFEFLKCIRYFFHKENLSKSGEVINERNHVSHSVDRWLFDTFKDIKMN